MENTMKYKIIAVLLLVSLVFFGLVSSASAASRFDEVVTRFSNIFVHAGDIEHEHKFSFNGGMSALFAKGSGELGGTHQAWSTETKEVSPVRRSAHSTATYFTTTAANALPGQYMTMSSGGMANSDHLVQSGVRPNPGASGFIRETVSSSSEAGNTYSEHSSNVGTSSGITRMETATDVSSSKVNVEGFSEVYESVVIDNGGPKTGWWSLP